MTEEDNGDLKTTKIEVLVALLSDMGSEVRSRREPESILTAAFVAASGAVAWGVAALNVKDSIAWCFHPAVVGALGIIFLAIAMIMKIKREYRTYEKARAEQGRLAEQLVELLGEDKSMLPEGLADPVARSGHRYSIGIVIAAGVAASLFCLSIYFK
jgi:hypothetical protein